MIKKFQAKAALNCGYLGYWLHQGTRRNNPILVSWNMVMLVMLMHDVARKGSLPHA